MSSDKIKYQIIGNGVVQRNSQDIFKSVFGRSKTKGANPMSCNHLSDCQRCGNYVEELETKLAAAEDELAKHITITEYYADTRRGDRRYSPARIAWELERTAMGDGHYGNALRVAKDLPGVTAEDRSMLDRYATGKQGGTDHVALQELAMRIDAGDIEVARGEE